MKSTFLVLALAVIPVQLAAQATSEVRLPSVLRVESPSAPVIPFLYPDVSSAPEGKVAVWRRIGGAAVSLYIGLGLGHHLEGFGEEAGIFTWTQLGTLAAAVVALAYGFCDLDTARPAGERCFKSKAGEGLFYVALAGYVGSRVWELVDVIVRPALHNAKIASPPQPAK